MRFWANSQQWLAHCRAFCNPAHGNGWLIVVRSERGTRQWLHPVRYLALARHGTIKTIVVRRTFGGRQSRRARTTISVRASSRASNTFSLPCAKNNTQQRS
jgi:hypothetical protein